GLRAVHAEGEHDRVGQRRGGARDAEGGRGPPRAQRQQQPDKSQQQGYRRQRAGQHPVHAVTSSSSLKGISSTAMLDRRRYRARISASPTPTSAAASTMTNSANT